jgi:outer membrane protein OmpA-like peptidoglycan-associated protein
LLVSATTESEEKETAQYEQEEQHAPGEEPGSGSHPTHVNATADPTAAPTEEATVNPTSMPTHEPSHEPSTSAPVPDATEFKEEPKDPCELWKAQVKAEEELAEALQKNVEFESGSTVLPEEGKDVLKNVAEVLADYPWMSIEVQGNSPAEGERGHTLVTGRAKAAAEYLTSIGVKNSLSETGVKSEKFIGLRVFPSGSTSRPASCAEDGDRALPTPAPAAGISVSLDTAG